ncbi:hypothetical protein [Peribacillus butanolivorans]|uniref:hypothetical protein n=1 Tax=Peribacillus butanolivorans TaxID=421767 RepID=UPI0036701205
MSKQIKEFTTLFYEGNHQIHEISTEVGEREFLDTSEIIDEYFQCTNKIVDIFNGLMNKEYEFIDIGSGIDIEIYKDIKALFETLGEKLSSTMGDFEFSSSLQDDLIFNDDETNQEKQKKLEDCLSDLFLKLCVVVDWLVIREKELNMLIQSKLEQYGKEML